MKSGKPLNPREQVVIIGNGIAGITSARHIRKLSDKRIIVISSESDHFFARTSLMYVYMGHLRWKDLKPYEDHFWEENRIELIRAYVTGIDTEKEEVLLGSGERLKYDTLVLATGSVPRKLDWEGQELKGVQGLVSKQDLELLELNSVGCKRAVIVGGGLIGVELAEMLHTRNIEVSMLLRESGFWGNVLPEQDSKFVSRHLESHGIKLLPQTQLQKISGDAQERVKAIMTDRGEELPCELVGLCIGVNPNIDFLRNSTIETDQGIPVDMHLCTNIPNVFAIGDCAQQRQPPGDRAAIEAVWYSARMMGETLAQTICGNPTAYSPGNWFNSAKFFDIEYQTYGRVASNPVKEEVQLHWEHPDGTKALTLAYARQSELFLGINSFGIRMRHEVFDRWLREKRSLEYVLRHLQEANFDPEFYRRHEGYILKSFCSAFP